MKKVLIALLTLLLSSCSGEDVNVTQKDLGGLVNLTREEFLSIAYDNPKELSPNEATVIVTDFLNQIKQDESNRKTATRSIGYDFHVGVSSKSYFSKDNTTSTRSLDNFQLPIYEVNVTSEDGGGIAYVSGDERDAEVITFIPNAPKDEELAINSGSAFLLKWAKTSAYERVMEVDALRDKLRNATVKKISSALNIPESSVTLDNVIDKIAVEGTRATPITMPNTQIIGAVYPLVSVQWNQTSPYNLSLPAPASPSTQKHVYTGCAVTAACQLMTAIKPNLTIDGTVIDWKYLTETKKITTSDENTKIDMLGKLFLWTYKTLRAMPMYDSSGYHNGTGVYSYMSEWFYGNYFNTGVYSKYNPDNLKRSFDLLRPAFIQGQGHAWLLDGYIVAKKAVSVDYSETRALVRLFDVFWHVNLGWGGAYDGYYKLNPDTNVKFEAGSHVYTTEGLSIYPGLYKKNSTYNVTTKSN